MTDINPMEEIVTALINDLEEVLDCVGAMTKQSEFQNVLGLDEIRTFEIIRNLRNARTAVGMA